MNYLLPINALFDRYWSMYRVGSTLFGIGLHQATHRGCRNPVCSRLRRIGELDEGCKACDNDALTSTTDHEYCCPWGLLESVLHIPLRFGTAHVIVGKYRREGDEAAKGKFLDTVQKYNLRGDLLAEYEKLPSLTREESEKMCLSLKKELEELAAGNYLKSLEDPTILQINEIFKKGMEDRKVFNVAREYDKLYSALGFTRHSLDDLIWELCGGRFTDFLRERRLIWAEHLLTNSTMLIKEIAHKFGYDEIYFSAFFKNYCKVSPRLFRNQAFLGMPHSLLIPF